MRALHPLHLLLLLLALPACDLVEGSDQADEQAEDAVIGGTYVGSEVHVDWVYEFVIPTTESGSFDFSGTLTHDLPNVSSPTTFTGSGTFDAPDVDIEFSYPISSNVVVEEPWTGTISADGSTLTLTGVADPGLRMTMERE